MSQPWSYQPFPKFQSRFRCVALYFIPLLLLQLTGCGDKSKETTTLPPRPVIALRVASSDVFAGRGLPGQARAALEATLAFRVGGRMTERRFKTGDFVKEGDVLATLDQAPYQADVDTSTANLARARAAYANAAGQLERDQQLFQKGVIAKARLEGSQTSADQASAEMKSLESALERRKLDLEYTVLRAPFSGVVSAVFAEAFEEIKPQQTIMRIIDPKKIEMVINVPESMISYIPYATDIKVTFDAFPGVEIPATISEIGKEPSETTRTYAVKLLTAPPGAVTIIPGMAGRAKARPGPEISNKFKGVVVPLAGVFSPDDTSGSYVWIIDENKKTVSRQKVDLGEPVIGGISIKDGLSPGSLIVIAGVHDLREGQQVRIQEQ